MTHSSKAARQYRRFGDALTAERRWREVENLERMLKAIYQETREAARDYRSVGRV